jgi:hypothetical protein
MNRIHGLMIASLAAAFVALPFSSSAGDKAPPAKSDHEAHAQHYWTCAEVCDDCARTCDACSTHCALALADGKKEHLNTLRTCQDCATICSAAATVTARSGPFSKEICTACAEACKRCGDACAKHKDDKMMARCSEVCFKCEKACREMLKHTERASR